MIFGSKVVFSGSVDLMVQLSNFKYPRRSNTSTKITITANRVSFGVLNDEFLSFFFANYQLISRE